MNEREKMIAAAQLKITGLKQLIKPLQEALDQAEHELRRAKETFLVGEHVEVEETCPRGCCIESYYTGVIIKPDGNNHWLIDVETKWRTPSGPNQRLAYYRDIKKLLGEERE